MPSCSEFQNKTEKFFNLKQLFENTQLYSLSYVTADIIHVPISMSFYSLSVISVIRMKLHQDLDFFVMFPTAGMTVDLVPVADTVREATAVGLTTPGRLPVT